MKTTGKRKSESAGFTLTDLCVLLGCLAVLGLLALPALAAGRGQTAAAGCLANLRRLMTGWEMYRVDSNDVLMPNGPLGSINNNTWAGSSAENWTTATANIDPSSYTNALMWRYVNQDLSVYRCPADVVPSSNGIRIRTYSMNGQMGTLYDATVVKSFNPNYLVYAKSSDIVRPTPANAFVFADESIASLNDSFLQPGLNSPVFPDVPACYHDGSCGFSFADGHGELHRWQTSTLLIPVRPGFTMNNVTPANGGQNADWLWLRQHSSSH